MAAKVSSKTPSAGLDKRTADLESAIAAITKSFNKNSIILVSLSKSKNGYLHI